MEVEVENKLGTSKGEHFSTRTGYRCGTRVRRFDARIGTMYHVSIGPKSSERWLYTFLCHGKEAKELGIESISVSHVSQLNKRLNEQVEEF